MLGNVCRKEEQRRSILIDPSRDLRSGGGFCLIPSRPESDGKEEYLYGVPTACLTLLSLKFPNMCEEGNSTPSLQTRQLRFGEVQCFD